MISKTRFHWTHKFYEKRELTKIINQGYRKWTYNREHQQVQKFFLLKTNKICNLYPGFHRKQNYKKYNNSNKNGNFTRDSKTIEKIIGKYYKQL